MRRTQFTLKSLFAVTTWVAVGCALMPRHIAPFLAANVAWVVIWGVAFATANAGDNKAR